MTDNCLDRIEKYGKLAPSKEVGKKFKNDEVNKILKDKKKLLNNENNYYDLDDPVICDDEVLVNILIIDISIILHPFCFSLNQTYLILFEIYHALNNFNINLKKKNLVRGFN